LSRREGESVLIEGGRVKVTVVELRAGRVRLLFEAERSIDIFRAELVEGKK
jgi:carbon storage regulator CsrA